jgi:RNA polymerase sigma-70 factor (ECF subfamily)
MYQAVAMNRSSMYGMGVRSWTATSNRGPAPEHVTDESLMAAVVGGNQSAFGTIVERYQTDLYRYCMSFLKNPERARDAAQEVFLKAYSKAGSFDGERPFRPWFFRIARNFCLNVLERDRIVDMSSLQDPAFNAFGQDGRIWESEMPNPAALALEDERHQCLFEALQRLPEREREIVELRFFQNMCARDIAAIVGSTEGAVRTKLHRTLKSLRADLSAHMA